MTFADETISLGSWIATDETVKLNRGMLIHFTKALFKAMDYAENEIKSKQPPLSQNNSSKRKRVYMHNVVMQNG